METAQITASRIETGTGAFFSLEAGRGPTVLLLHGVTANAYVWLPVMHRLLARFRVVALDQRGHGRTGVTGTAASDPAAWSQEAYAGDALGFLRSLGDQSCLVVGHSLGARNALAAAAREPAAVRGVVAVDFTPFIEDAVFDALEARVGSGARSFRKPEEVEAYLRGRYPNLPDAAIERRARYGYAHEGDAWVPLADPAAMMATCRGLRADLATVVAAIEVPTLFVRGVRSAVVSADAWRASMELRPDLEWREVPTADHYVPEEAPELVAAMIERFDDSLDRSEPDHPRAGTS